MPKADTWELGLLNLLFNNTAFGGVGDSTGLPASGTTGNLYVSLHTSTPGDAGDQTVGEASYTGYQRVAVARTSGGWTVAEASLVASAVNTAQTTFPQCTGGNNTITFVGVGTAPSTTVAAGSNGQALPGTGNQISVASTVGFPSSGTILVWNGSSYQTVTYTNTSGGNTFTGTSGGTGTISTGFPVLQAGKLLYYGALTSSLAVSNNITPSFAAGALVIAED